MKDGKLSKMDRAALLRAQRILDKWTEFHEGKEVDEFVSYLAESGAGAISNFLNETKGE